MTFRQLISSGVLASFVLAGCSNEQSTTTQASALEGEGNGTLVIESFTDNEFTGSFESEFGAVKVFAFVESDTKLSAMAFVNDTQIDMSLTSEDGGHVGFYVHGGTLDVPAHALLTGIHDELADRFPYPGEDAIIDEKTPQHVALLRNYLGFLSEAPIRLGDHWWDTKLDREPLREPGEPPPTKPSQPPVSPPSCVDVPDDDGITLLTACCNGGATLAFQHDDLPGGHCFMTLGGVCGLASPAGCAGRCGPGCSAVSGYYQDCFDHDMCLVHDAGGSGITPAGKCGDEWWEGVDDFAFAYAAGAPLIWWLRSGGPCN